MERRSLKVYRMKNNLFVINFSLIRRKAVFYFEKSDNFQLLLSPSMLTGNGTRILAEIPQTAEPIVVRGVLGRLWTIAPGPRQIVQVIVALPGPGRARPRAVWKITVHIISIFVFLNFSFSPFCTRSQVI